MRVYYNTKEMFAEKKPFAKIRVILRLLYIIFQ